MAELALAEALEERVVPQVAREHARVLRSVRAEEARRLSDVAAELEHNASARQSLPEHGHVRGQEPAVGVLDARWARRRPADALVALDEGFDGFVDRGQIVYGGRRWYRDS